MASKLISTKTQGPKSVENNIKTVGNKTGDQSLTQNEHREEESLITLQPNGVALTSASQLISQNSYFTASNSASETAIVPQTVVESMIQQGFPALAKTTKPIPASVFSYRFASASNSQTPYYISSDIVLSGGIAQQTRRRIVHNEVERRRKDKINNWITKLAEVIPKCAFGKQSKNIVLENAVEYLTELHGKLKRLEESHQHKNKLELENQALKAQLSDLNEMNKHLTILLHKNNITIPDSLNENIKIDDKQTSCTTSTQGNFHQPSNTTTSWSTSGNISSTFSSLENINHIVQTLPCTTSLGKTDSNAGQCVPQSQPYFSTYTVSSIMNQLPNSVSIVNASLPNNQVENTAMPSIQSVSTAKPVIPIQISSINIQPISSIGVQSLNSLPSVLTNGPKDLSSQNVLLCQKTIPQNGSQGPTFLNTVANVPSQCVPQIAQNSQIIDVPSVSFIKQGASVINVPNGSFVNVPSTLLSSKGSEIAQAPLGTVVKSTKLVTSVPNQSPSVTFVTPSSSEQLLAFNGNRTALITNSIITPNQTSTQPSLSITNNSLAGPGNLTVITKAVGLPLANAVQVIPATMVTQGPATNCSVVSTAPISMTTQSTDLASMNIPTCPVGLVKPLQPAGALGASSFINVPQPNIVTLKFPKTSIQTINNAPMPLKGNVVNCRTTGTVNLTPSPGTAFVIVRSTPSQQTSTTHRILQTQTSQLSSETCSVAAAANLTISSAMHLSAQPTNTSVLQSPYAVMATPTSAAIVTTQSVPKRNQHSDMVKVNASAPLQPPVKISKNNNGKKRQTNRSNGSKTKSSKQRKTKNNQLLTTTVTPAVASRRETLNRELNSSNADMCHQDILSIQNFSISSLIPSIENQSKTNSSSLNENKKQGESIRCTKESNSLRLSHSIDALTGRTQEQNQQQPQQSIMSFSAEGLLGSGEDIMSNFQPSSTSSRANNLNMPSFQDNQADGNINQSFSNFTAEALISETDFIGISNDCQTSRSNCTQGTQNAKSAPNRTQMFSDFSAESLINSSDLGSGLSYAIDNLISRSDNSDSSIAMTSVNPNLLHSNTSNMLPDNMGHSVFNHNSSGPLVKNYFDLNTSTDSLNQSFTKYSFTSSQKQTKEILTVKSNATTSFTMTTSPSYLKHSVDSITASQHNSVPTGMYGTIVGNAGTSFNSILQMDQMNPQQYQASNNPFGFTGNITKTSYQGPTVGSFSNLVT